ncbi:MAG: rhodanese-like domain-containing protein [Candidatus Marinimicrobia bacterium]|nr:rhodanese-like domain-containing protein [Candidatus Neomarinimicrobiota bacterium]
MKIVQKIWTQGSILLLLSIFIGVTINLSRKDSVPWLAQPLSEVNELELILQPVYEPFIKNISIEIAEQLVEKNIPFVDARDDEYYREGHIPNAVSSSDFLRLTEYLDISVGLFDPFVVYCSDDDCGSSEELAIQLQAEGYMNIYVFKGGWKEWNKAGLPIVMDSNE